MTLPVPNTSSLPLQLHGKRSSLQRGIASLCAVAMLMAGNIPAVHAQNNLPALGDNVSSDLSVGDERRLGDQIMREIRRDPDYLDDPISLEYLDSIWNPLLAAARKRGDIDASDDQRYAWESFLVRDRSVNAFALPGGFVGVNLGLISITATRDELASVLAHELSHVTQRHIARSMVNSQRQSLIGLAALIVGALAASRMRGDAGSAIITGGQAAAMQGQLNFSRDMEREADRVGFSVMTSAGFSPGGMAAMFERLGHASNLNDTGAYPYLRSHPLTTERIGEARARMGAGAVAVSSVSPLEHAVARARARVLMDSRDDALRRWQAQDTDRSSTTDADKLSAVYESALASTLLRDWPRADAALVRAAAIARDVPAAARGVSLLAGQSLIARGDLEGAAARLQPYASEGSRPVTLMSAQIALGARTPNTRALQLIADGLQTWVATRPADADAWSTLGRIWDKLGFNLRAIRADAESRVAVGDYAGAADRLRAGQRMARTGKTTDFIEASVIDARLRDVEIERKRQETEKPLG